jgi:8-oxo-dGTP diphosphatase
MLTGALPIVASLCLMLPIVLVHGWVPTSVRLRATKISNLLRKNIQPSCRGRHQNLPFIYRFCSTFIRDGEINSAISSGKSRMEQYPRAAVSTAVRCIVNEKPHYLLIQRGKAPNAGKWSFPGGKLEWGESALEGAKRELAEETQFEGQESLQWHPEPYSTADSIIQDDDQATLFHFLIAISFAELTIASSCTSPPKVTSQDDAKDAKWWSLQEMQGMDTDSITPGLVQRVLLAEFLYQKDVLA